MTFLLPLDIQGVTIEGLFLRGRTYENSFDRDVMFQLEYAAPGSRTRVALARVDWLPRSPVHKNPDHELITGSHLHPFEANWLDREQRMRAGNLPFAVRTPPSVGTYAKLLDFVGKEFRISNMSSIPVPGWVKSLFS